MQIYDALVGKNTITTTTTTTNQESEAVIDTILDDREKSLAWKLKDADLIGYPVVVGVGKKFEAPAGEGEVVGRRVGIRGVVALEDVREVVGGYLAKL